MNYKELYDNVQEGRMKALPAYIDLKAFADDLAITLEALKEEAVREFNDEWGGKEQIIHGAMVSRHAGGRYDYKAVPGWKGLKDKLTLLEKSSQLAYKAGGAVVDDETGEVIVPATYVPNKESLTIKIVA